MALVEKQPGIRTSDIICSLPFSVEETVEALDALQADGKLEPKPVQSFANQDARKEVDTYE
jgi:hypothetical protein